MRFWNNSSLLAKLFIPQILVICACVVIIVSGSKGFDTITGLTARIIDNDIARTLLVFEAKDELAQVALAGRSAAGTTDKEALKSFEAVFTEHGQKAQKIVTKLAAVIQDPNRHKIITTIDGDIQKYLAAYDQYFNSRHNEAPRETIEALSSETVKIRKGILENFSVLVEAYKVTVNTRREEIVATGKETSNMNLWVSVVGLLLSYGLLGWITLRQVIRPLNAVIRNLDQVAEGNLDISVEATERHDEVGKLMRSLQVFKDNALKVGALQREQKEAEERAEKNRKTAMLKMADDFESSVLSVVKGVAASSTEMQATAQNMSEVAGTTSNQATSVAAATTQASSNVETVASAAEELSASVNEITSHVTDAARMAQQAADECKSTEEMVEKLASSSLKIGEIVDLINQIAAKTNLLALNATIEAARAGEAGKGFAVVASEVKHLANQTAKATDEIGTQVASIQSDTNNAVGAIRAISGTIDKVRNISSSIATAVEEQGSATREIARNVQQASQGTHEVAENIHLVTQGATQTGAAAEQVLATAGELAHNAEVLHKEVENFLTNVRAN
jgi:methyl-accepting chemotaxis protein